MNTWGRKCSKAKSQGRTFHGRCQITESHISREMPNHRVAHFTGDAKSQGRTFHGRCQITESHISREMPNHGWRHFTGDRQITGLVIYWTIDKSQDWAFHGGWSALPSLSNAFHRSFFWVIARKIVKSQDGVISREIGKLQDWSFNGRSTNRRIGRFTGDAGLFPHCQTLFIVHFFESLHGRLSNRRMASFHGRSANYRTGHLTDDRQIAGLGVSRGMLGSSLIVKRFTGSRQITRSRISQEMPNHRVAHFTGDGQITGPRISREMPNRRSEHFTSCQSLHIFLHCFIFQVLGLKLFFVNHFFFELSFLGSISETDKQTNRHTNCYL